VNRQETHRLRFIKCGKPNCRCASGQGHGPYWYACYHDAKGWHERYIGKVQENQMHDEPAPPPEMDPRWLFDSRRMSFNAALRIMAFATLPSVDALQRRYRSLVFQHHPDKGGNGSICAAINAAYEYLRKAPR
jgi:hypothetical protein